MNLKRYNDWLIAFGGTAVAGLAVFAIGSRLYDSLRPEFPRYASPGIALNAQANKSPQNQQLVYCAPILIPGTDTQLFPVAIFSSRDPGSVSTVQYDQSYNVVAHELPRTELSCHAPGATGEARAFNILIRDSHSNEQRLLLSAPAQVLGIHVPAVECRPQDTALPCDGVLLSIRDTDADADGILDEADPATLYVADLSLKVLHRLSPPGKEVLSWTWDERSKSLLILVAADKAQQLATQLLSTHGPEWLPASPVVQESVRQTLQAALH